VSKISNSKGRTFVPQKYPASFKQMGIKRLAKSKDACLKDAC
jgi:hypothetical protein